MLADLGTRSSELARKGAAAIYGGELGRSDRRAPARAGGAITRADLAAYRVIRRRPVRARFRGHEFVSNPPPSSGGVLIGYGLALLDALGPAAPPGSADAIAALAEVMREQGARARASFARELYRGGLARRLSLGENVARRRSVAIRAGLAGAAEPAAAARRTSRSSTRAGTPPR